MKISTIIQIIKTTNRIPAKIGADETTILYKKEKTAISIAKNPINETNLTKQFQRKTKNPIMISFNVINVYKYTSFFLINQVFFKK